jgi:MYXO-CTERM domain-containing protein
MGTRNRHRSIGRLAAAAAAAGGLWGIAAGQASAGVIVDGVLIDLRATQLNGAPVPDPKHVAGVLPGDVITMQLFTITTGTNGIDDEASHTIHGALRSSTGGLLGNIAAQLVAPFNGSGSSSGTMIDVDSDGDLDVSGANPNLAAGYFNARNAAGFTDGTRIGGDSEESLMGGLTFTVAPGAIGETLVNFFQHRTTSGGNNFAWGVYMIDGNNNGTSPRNPTNTQVGGDGVLISSVPEPGAVALAGVAALGLLARRKKSDR